MTQREAERGEKQKRRYLLVKIATEQYKLNPELLSAEQRTEVEGQIEKVQQLQSAIMASKEAHEVKISAKEVMAAYKECVAQFDSEQAFYHTLKTHGMTVEGYKQALHDELFCDTVMDYVAQDVPPLNKQQAIEYYNKK